MYLSNMITHTGYSAIDGSARHISAVELCEDVVPDSRDAHSNSSNTFSATDSEEPTWLLEEDDTYKTQTADRGGTFDAYPGDGPPNASSMAEQTTLNPHHREKLKEDELRLVKVRLGSEDELLQCETRIVPASANSNYTAVSYAWGPPIAEHPIELDGQKYKLPTNLWQFLKAWRTCKMRHGKRSEEFDYWLWVDALCINQSDAQERTHQVRIMSRIFGGARSMLVWLGPSNEEVDDLMGWWSQRFKAGSSLEPRWNHIVGLRDLCERSYWSRLWVFQELKSAEDIRLMCGCHDLPWTTFGKALTEAPSISGQDYTVLRRDSWQERDNTQQESLKYRKLSADASWERKNIAHQRASRHVKLTAATKMIDLCMGSAPTSLWLLLQTTSHLRCHDPRDKVYAILSMTKTGCDEIDADYELPLPRLMHRVLSNSYANCPPQGVHDVAVRCARLKAMMGLEAAFPWGADEYFAAENENRY